MTNQQPLIGPILALDTSADMCSLALLTAERVFCRHILAPQKQTEILLPTIAGLLNESGVARSELRAIAVGRGPGSFTGIRIAVGAAQALAFALAIPVIPVSTLQALAYRRSRLHAEKDLPIVALMDARMGEVYAAVYRFTAEGEVLALMVERVCSPQHLPALPETFLIAGNGWRVYQSLLAHLGADLAADEIPYVNAEDIALLARRLYQRGEMIAAKDLQPVYLRDQVTQVK